MAEKGIGTPVPRFWNIITAEGADYAEITMYGDIVERVPRDWWTGEEIDGQYITPEDFAEDLERIKDKARIIIKLNSGGGDVYTALAIHNALKSLPAHKTVIVEGLAASAASVIMCAGDEVHVYPGSIVMVHGVSGYVNDRLDIFDVRKLARNFDAVERAMATIYAEKTGKTIDEMRQLMNAETWMTGQQAVDQGFADNIIRGEEVEAKLSADKTVLLVAGIGHDIRGCKHIPREIPIGSTAASVTASDKNTEKEATHMTEKELREQFPDLVASIEAQAAASAQKDAAAAERARIRDIEAIASQIADKSMVDAAKYGETPMTAPQLALEAMKAQAALGAQFLGNLKADAEASNADKVQPEANSGYADNGDPESKLIAGATALYNKMKGRTE